jgi:cyclophilin family peptidyl-prolyl cis-trans isomerase
MRYNKSRRSRYGIFDSLCLLALVLSGSGSALATNVIFQTDLGNFEIELFDKESPQTVANFLNYVNDGDYANSFIHRAMPGFVIQGGGHTFTDGTADSISADPPVANEPGISNVRGTIAMAKLPNDPDSATSEWFINLADNSANLDNQNGGFTVFGQVTGDGMDVVDAIAALPVWNAGSPFTDLPLIDYPGNVAITTEHLVMLDINTVSDFQINAGLNDAWVNDGAELQGLFITVFPDLGLIFLAWFTFDSVLSPDDGMAGFGSGDQRWVTAIGRYVGNQAVLKAELTSGGMFNSSNPLPVQDTEYGTITLEFENCTLANVIFDFPSAGESGQFDIRRVLEDNEARCVLLNSGAS